jgi:hypothetical protein
MQLEEAGGLGDLAGRQGIQRVNGQPVCRERSRCLGQQIFTHQRVPFLVGHLSNKLPLVNGAI